MARVVLAKEIIGVGEVLGKTVGDALVVVKADGGAEALELGVLHNLSVGIRLINDSLPQGTHLLGGEPP